MYSVIFSDEAAAEIAAIAHPTDRQRLLAAIQCLTADPESTGTADAIDGHGRMNRIGVVGANAFVYWADHAMKRLRIVAIASMLEE